MPLLILMLLSLLLLDDYAACRQILASPMLPLFLQDAATLTRTEREHAHL